MPDRLPKRSLRHRSGDSRRASRAFDPFLGPSPAMRRLARAATRCARGDDPILICGETGTGKGLLAHWLHEHGSRAQRDFVEIGCLGLSGRRLRGELFGYRPTLGEVRCGKQGLLEIAHRGTLFLDEVGELDRCLRARLWEVVERKRSRRFGEEQEREVDVRLIAAASRELGSCRALVLSIPPLRERPADVPVLARDLLLRLAPGRRPPRLTSDVVRALRDYPWPGNVRELRNVLERALLLGSSPLLTAVDLHFESCRLRANGP